MLVASAVFLLVVAAVMVGNSFGLRMMELCRPKLLAAGEIRKAVNLFHSELGAAKYVRVGNFDLSTFTVRAPGERREGGAIQIYPGTNKTDFIQYYLDPGDRNLKRMTNGGASAVIATAIGNSNNIVFAGENFRGQVLTNDQNNMAIRVRLEYMQMPGSSTPIGPANYYKAHWTETRTTIRER
jgi:hypothetical protein